jgi:hypothetical protein
VVVAPARAVLGVLRLVVGVGCAVVVGGAVVGAPVVGAWGTAVVGACGGCVVVGSVVVVVVVVVVSNTGIGTIGGGAVRTSR